MFGTNMLVNTYAQGNKHKKLSTLLMHMISQITLQRVVTTFNLGNDYFNKFNLVSSSESNIKNGVSGQQIVVHQQRIPEEEIIVEERPKKVDIVERKHRLDKHRLYFPGYL